MASKKSPPSCRRSSPGRYRVCTTTPAGGTGSGTSESWKTSNRNDLVSDSSTSFWRRPRSKATPIATNQQIAMIARRASRPVVSKSSCSAPSVNPTAIAAAPTTTVSIHEPSAEVSKIGMTKMPNGC
jgi:hypothetical protein